MNTTPKHGLTEPRSWIALFWRLKGWIVAIGFAVLIGLTIASVNSYRKAGVFDRDGVSVTAEAVSRRIEYGSHDDEGDEYFVTFSFAANGGAVYRVEREVSRRFYNRSNFGTRHVIRYLGHDPMRVEYYVGEFRDDGITLQLFALVIGAAALGGLWFVGDKTNTGIRSRRDGIKMVGEVMRIEELRDKEGDKTGQAVLHWIDPDGRIGQSLPQDIGVIRRYARGDVLTLYKHPRRDLVWWEGDVGPRKYRSGRFPKVSR